MFSIVRKKCTVATDYTKDTFMMKKGKEGGWKSWNGNIFFSESTLKLMSEY